MKKYSIIYLTLLSSTLGASAQTLSEEVVIDREIIPVERPAVRPTWLMPSLLTPGIEKTRLSFKEYLGVAEITRSISPLEPVAWADSVMRTPYDGYASIGYFPTYNLDVAAGYRFIRTEKLNVGAHISYDGSSWSGYHEDIDRYSRNKIAVGADATAVFNPGTLRADINYAWSETSTAQHPLAYHRGSQSLNTVDVDVCWKPSHKGVFGWDVSGNFGFGGFTSNKTDQLMPYLSMTRFDFKPVRDVTAGVASNLSLKVNNSVDFVVGLGADLRHVADFTYVEPFIGAATNVFSEEVFLETLSAGAKTMGIINVRPGFEFGSSRFSGRAGIRVDFNTGGWQKDTHIAPDVDLRWSPLSTFSIVLKATGGEVMNTNASLWQRNPWMTGTLTTERSHLNGDVQLSFTFGSYKGFWAVLNGGWSSVSNWVTPVLMNGVNTWARMDNFNGFNYGLELGYAWKDKVVVTGHAKGAGHGRYYRWEDNPSWAFDIGAKVRPIDRLQIELGYEVRIDRWGHVLTPVIVDGTPCFYATKQALGDTSNLYLGGSYRITDAFSAFVKAENLLNYHWFITSGIRSQGIHGLVGIQYLF
ncbi:MAG: hypothetical protein J1F20_05500 [Muribaculaceae bacterium]|nr:hypothetical protein [Muribaculaceae bacterium]